MPSMRRRAMIRRLGLGCSAGLLGLSGCAGDGTDGVRTPFSEPAYRASFERGAEWPMAGHDPGQRRWTTAPVPTEPTGIAWLRRPQGDPWISTNPVVGPNSVYFGYTESGQDRYSRLVAYDAEDGTTHDNIRLAGKASGGAVLDDALFFLTRTVDPDRSSLFLIATDEMAIQWQIELSKTVSHEPILAGDRCYLLGEYVTEGFTENTLFAYDPAGVERFRKTFDREVGLACLDEQHIYVVGGGQVIAISRESGTSQWTQSIDVSDSPTAADGRLYVPGSERFVAFDGSDGSVIWERPVVTSEGYDSPSVSAESIYVTNAGREEELIAIDPADGRVRWRTQQPSYDGPPVIGDGGIIMPGGDAVAAHHPDNDPLWEIDITPPDPPGDIGYGPGMEIALAHGMCYVGIQDGRLYAIGET